jgi:hypothetical protein
VLHSPQKGYGRFAARQAGLHLDGKRGYRTTEIDLEITYPVLSFPVLHEVSSDYDRRLQRTNSVAFFSGTFGNERLTKSVESKKGHATGKDIRSVGRGST